MSGNMDWVDQQEERQKEERSKEYFSIQEGDNRIQLLSHCAALPQVWMQSEGKYRPAEEGDKNVSVKGLCWVLQDGVIKSAKLPYTVVKSIKELMADPDYSFEGFPMPRLINIKAKNAGSKEVEYTVIPAPKETEVPAEILAELKAKPTPEEMVEKLKGKKEVSQRKNPDEEANPDLVPF